MRVGSRSMHQYQKMEGSPSESVQCPPSSNFCMKQHDISTRKMGQITPPHSSVSRTPSRANFNLEDGGMGAHRHHGNERVAQNPSTGLGFERTDCRCPMCRHSYLSEQVGHSDHVGLHSGTLLEHLLMQEKQKEAARLATLAHSSYDQRGAPSCTCVSCGTANRWGIRYDESNNRILDEQRWNCNVAASATGLMPSHGSIHGGVGRTGVQDRCCCRAHSSSTDNAGGDEAGQGRQVSGSGGGLAAARCQGRQVSSLLGGEAMAGSAQNLSAAGERGQDGGWSSMPLPQSATSSSQGTRGLQDDSVEIVYQDNAMQHWEQARLVTEGLVMLYKWYLIKVPHAEGGGAADYGHSVAVGGFLVADQAEKVRTAAIVERLDFRKLLTCDGVEVRLQGCINQDASVATGFPMWFVQCFMTGFPYIWKHYLMRRGPQGESSDHGGRGSPDSLTVINRPPLDIENLGSQGRGVECSSPADKAVDVSPGSTTLPPDLAKTAGVEEAARRPDTLNAAVAVTLVEAMENPSGEVGTEDVRNEPVPSVVTLTDVIADRGHGGAGEPETQFMMSEEGDSYVTVNLVISAAAALKTSKARRGRKDVENRPVRRSRRLKLLQEGSSQIGGGQADVPVAIVDTCGVSATDQVLREPDDVQVTVTTLVGSGRGAGQVAVATGESQGNDMELAGDQVGPAEGEPMIEQGAVADQVSREEREAVAVLEGDEAEEASREKVDDTRSPCKRPREFPEELNEDGEVLGLLAKLAPITPPQFSSKRGRKAMEEHGQGLDLSMPMNEKDGTVDMERGLSLDYTPPVTRASWRSQRCSNVSSSNKESGAVHDSSDDNSPSSSIFPIPAKGKDKTVDMEQDQTLEDTPARRAYRRLKKCSKVGSSNKESGAVCDSGDDDNSSLALNIGSESEIGYKDPSICQVFEQPCDVYTSPELGDGIETPRPLRKHGVDQPHKLQNKKTRQLVEERKAGRPTRRSTRKESEPWKGSSILPPPLPAPRVQDKSKVPKAYGLKTSRSGRLLVPPLAYWRSQSIGYDKDGGIIAIFDGFKGTAADTGCFTFKPPEGKNAKEIQKQLCEAALRIEVNSLPSKREKKR